MRPLEQLCQRTNASYAMVLEFGSEGYFGTTVGLAEQFGTKKSLTSQPQKMRLLVLG